jgi:acetylornithine deacetylase/succinyl-diaminopimelate desuccinylase-like protein
VVVAAVVQEERGGVGSRGLVETVVTDCAVIGEPTSNRLARGHRGRHELIVSVQGKSVHGSVPDEGVNPHAVMARVIQSLEGLQMAHHPAFGHSSVAPTLYTIDQRSSNVIPGKARLHLDWRAIPGESTEDATAQVVPLLEKALAQVPGSQGAVNVASYRARTYTGRELDVPLAMDGFIIDKQNPLLRSGHHILAEALERPIDIITWTFGTDAARLIPAGIPVIGFGPSEAEPIHTVHESVPIAMLGEGLRAYAALALNLGRAMIA